MRRLLACFSLALLLFGPGCGADLRCGMGTHRDGALCFADPTPEAMLEPTPWSANVRVGTGDDPAGVPGIAVDSHGHVYIAFQAGALVGRIEVWRSDDGKSFEQMLQVPAQGSSTGGLLTESVSGPTIAVDGQDRVIAVWRSLQFGLAGTEEIAFRGAVSRDGRSFDPSRVIAQPPLELVSRPRLGAAPGGAVVAAWRQGYSIVQVRTSTTDGAFLDPTSLAFSDPSTLLAPIAFRAGKHPVALLVQARSDGDRIAVAALDPPGRTAYDTLVAEERHFSFPFAGAIAPDGAGGLRALFTDARARRTGIFEIRSDASGNFTMPERVLDDATLPTATAPSLVADPESSSLHALFFDTRSGGWLLYAAHAPEGGAFGGVERVSEVEQIEDLSSDFSAFETALTVRGSMRYAAWTDPRGGVFFASAPLP